ncbi:MAG: Lrp/AsnC family transcriptional regulator, partial [Gammaproteobacteria bacterium]|nr:Lrp/AsnC family transcriptional regulator [Gammaproteobacteria bacterium]
MTVDQIDKRILQILQDDGQTTNQELADKVALSPSPCSRRVKLLEDEGYIDKYVALLNPEKLDLQLTVMVSVGLSNHNRENMADFESKIQTIPEVIECALLTGQSADYLLKVIVPNMQEFQKFLLDKLTAIKSVSNIHSSFV